eukprot:604151-Amphidinium_carterae.1
MQTQTAQDQQQLTEVQAAKSDIDYKPTLDSCTTSISICQALSTLAPSIGSCWSDKCDKPKHLGSADLPLPLQYVSVRKT